MIVQFKKLSPNAITPSYAKDGDAGLDISAITYMINKEHNFGFFTIALRNINGNFN